MYDENKDNNLDDSFDARLLNIFKVGNLVSWKELDDEIKEYGFIQEIYIDDSQANRKFTFARVKKTNGSTENFMLSSLTKET